ncbi:universal stress protein [Herbaspirillum sp. RV1423]|uniref:universal stress protein n=1 Tax=Herbaspirillum sp. RV1423 TaxID=1443993 RepID=UPI0004B2B95E|nr:universal stress protein [Herbaspirillum sp. RV1423]
MYAKILVPVDGSTTANQALDEAIKLAHALGSTIEALYVVDNSHLLYDTGFTPSADIHGAVVDAGQAILDEAKARIVATGLQGDTRMVESQSTPGDVPGAILKAAKDSKAELVVIGSHGRTGFRRLVLGSVAEKVMHQCPLPVWIIRGKEA